MKMSLTRRQTVATIAGLSGAFAASNGEFGTASATARRDGRTEWTAYAGGPGHAKYAPGGPRELSEIFWAVGDGVAGDPVVVGETVYFGQKESLKAVSLYTGETQWSTSLGSSLVVSPAFGDGTIVVSTDDSTLYGLDASDGTERWSVGLGGKLGYPVIHDGAVYVGSDSGQVFSFAVDDGTHRWSTEVGEVDNIEYLPVTYRPSPAVVDDVVVVNVNDGHGGTAVALDLKDGSERWTYRTDGFYAPIAGRGLVCLPQESPREYLTSGGAKRFVHDAVTYSPLQVAIGPDHAVEYLSNEVVAYDRTSGEKQWSQKVAEESADDGGIALDDERVYVAHPEAGKLVALDLKTGFRANGFTVSQSGLPDGVTLSLADDAVLIEGGGSLYAVGTSPADATTTAAEKSTAESGQSTAESTRSTTESAVDASGETTVSSSSSSGESSSGTSSRGFFVRGDGGVANFLGEGPTLTVVSTAVTLLGMTLTIIEMVRGGE